MYTDGNMTSILGQLFKSVNLINFTQYRGAARKGIRIKRARDARLRAQKRRLLEAQQPKQKKVYGSSVKIDKKQLRLFGERDLESSLLDIPVDNVYFFEKYKQPKYSFEECIQFHRQVCHPDVLNVPSSLVEATIELNLKMKIKKKRYIETINSTVCFPNVFKYQMRPRKIVAISKDEDQQVNAKNAGAIISGGMDIVQMLKTKQLTQRDFDHLVCHKDILLDFSNVKGMKGSTYFPTSQRGNFGEDMAYLVRYFKDGIDYSLKKQPDEPSYGIISCYFGKLDMTNEQLKNNLLTLFNSVNRFKPLNLEDGKQFFQRVIISTPVSDELFNMKFWEIFEEYVDPDTIGEEEVDKKEAN